MLSYGKGRVSIVEKYGKVMWCKSENHVPNVTIFSRTSRTRRRQATDCKSQVPEHQEIRCEQFVRPISQARRIQAWHRVTDCISLCVLQAHEDCPSPVLKPPGSTTRQYLLLATITADHTVLNEMNDSRLQRRYAVVVLDLDSCWNQRYPSKRKLLRKR